MMKLLTFPILLASICPTIVLNCRRMGLGHAHEHENVTIDWDAVKWDELSPEEKWNLEHIR